ncbi:leucine-rich repeat neuronal protein 1-like [Limulus polyphemus]|uniref:Leucine-rich repeat neuronal protein 1-like n=1 Tax=Limulus polyphemus TaxID=6850 RepID=A0ABM1BPS4_LIMPO|nr:leucine-rich repeat neuronal protein 1-like [Limulus polyphemus]
MVSWIFLAFCVLLLTSVISSHISCPLHCDCVQRMVNCTSRGLHKIPDNIPLHTELLFLSENRLTNLVKQIPFLPRLLDLNLSTNQIKQLGRGSIFQNLTELRLLDLSNNKFRTLFNGVFRGLYKLETLIITNGHLKFIDEHVFDDMSNLKHLNLRENSIHSMPVEWFYDMMNLVILELDNNEIYYLNSGTFTSLNNLRHLSLSHNRIRGISEKAFLGLRNLTTLLLNHNNIAEVPTVALQSMKRLKVFFLDANPIPKLVTDDFTLFSVKEISLSNTTTLQMIDRGAFRDLGNLEKVYLHNNPSLHYVDPHAFINVPKLRVLLLHKNNLSVLSYETVYERPAVQLTMYDNPLLCDCNVRWIQKALNKKENSSIHFLNSDQLKCSQPQILRSFPLKALSLASIPEQCEPVLVDSRNETVDTKMGDSQIFECRAFGIPPPKIHWIVPSGSVVNESNNDLRIQIKHSNILLLYHLKPKDSGIYQCVAENNMGVAIKNTVLQVGSVDIGLFPQRVSSTFVTVVWNGTARNNFPEYDILYKTDNRPGEQYQTVTVSYVYRSYTINNLEPDTSYKLCIAVKDKEEEKYIKLSCTHVHTRDASFIMQGIYTTSNVAVAVVLGIVAAMLCIVCLVSMAAKKYRQRHYETPEKSLITDMAHVPPENLNSPLMPRVGS